MKTLLLTLFYPNQTSYYDDWLEAFQKSKDFKVDVFDIFPRKSYKRLNDIHKNYDLIIILHACTSDSLLYVEPIKTILQSRRGKLLSFIGNEYNHPALFLSDKINFLTEIEADFVATQLPIEAGLWAYQEIGAKILEAPHALNPNIFKPLRDPNKRSLDLGMRSYRYPAFLGDNDRNRLYDYFKNLNGLKLDFSQEKRFSRTDWAEFLNNCRGTIATEAGSFYLERQDEIVKAIRNYISSKQKGLVIPAHSPIRRIVSAMPIGVKSFLKQILKKGPIKHETLEIENLDFDEIYETFFKHKNKCPVHSKAISSRHFDAIGTKTIQIMFEGYFNGILKQGEHYIALKADFSNINEVMEQFKDITFCQKIVDQTYDYIQSSHLYENRIKQLYKQIISTS